ncbi:MAG: ROK family protein [Clostridia bacterium]|nr:ROK family protein [Clostridia bacterium]
MVYIGIDLGGTNIAVGVCDEKLRIIKKGSVPTNPDRAPELIVKDMADLSAKLLQECGCTLDDVASVGIATPGTANSDTGVVEYSNNIPFLNFPIADVFKSFLPVKRVLIENDANAAALAEALSGAAKGTKKSVMITLGTGVGGGIVIDGKVYSGFNHAGGELGHIVIEKDGRPCSCGRRGCWEAYSSATGLVNMTREKVNECKIKGIPSLMVDEFDQTGRISARTAFAAMKKGDKAGTEVVREYVDYLACGLTNIINIFQPEVLSIGGGICGEGDYLLKPLLEIIRTEQYTRKLANRCQVRIAELGNDAGIIGAAGLGL